MFADIKIQLYINIIDILKKDHSDTMVKGDKIHFNNNVLIVTEDKNVITLSLTNTPSRINVRQNITWFELERSLDDVISSLFIDLNNYIESLKTNTLSGIREAILSIYNIPIKDIEEINEYTIKISIEENFTMEYILHDEFVRSVVTTRGINKLTIDTTIGKFVPEYLLSYIIPTMKNFLVNTI